ncbi:hypothetical protein VWN77_10565, partial [Campylobacter coli]
CPSEKYFWKFNDMNELECYNPKFGIYLGKIVFDKKGNKLIPNYNKKSALSFHSWRKFINQG